MNCDTLARARTAMRLAFVVLVLLGTAALIGVSSRNQSILTQAECPPPHADALRALGSMGLSPLSWELAGTGLRAARQLRPVADSQIATPPTVGERVCIQARIRFLWHGYDQLDTPLFMPLYGLLSVLIAAWVALQGGPRPRDAAWAVLPATALLLWLDSMENMRALALLQGADSGLLQGAGVAALDPAALALRQASLAKWAATGAWATSLAWAVGRWRPAIQPRRVRWLRWATVGLMASAAVMFGMASAWAWLSGEFARPIRMLEVGMALALLAMPLMALAIGFSHEDADKPVEAPVPYLLKGARQDFHMEEYRQLRTEVISLLTRIEMLFRAAIVVAATAFAWIVSSSLGLDDKAVCLKLPRALVVFGWLIPPTFVLCTGLMAKVTYLRVGEFSGYLRQLEQALGKAGLGWEAYLAQRPTRLEPMTVGLWLLLFALTITATLVGLLTVEQAVGGCKIVKV